MELLKLGQAKRGERMRKYAFIVFMLFLVMINTQAQDIIENPERPLSKNAGRVLKLKEVLSITDESGKFYFKRPGRLKIAPDGCFFISDEEQFLKFTPQGQFTKNLFKKGQGPGEIQQYFYFILHDDSIYVYDPMNIKIIHMDIDGKLIEEFKFRERYAYLLGIVGDNFILWNADWPGAEERTGKWHDIPNYLFIVTRDGKVIKRSPSIPIKWYLEPGRALSASRLITTFNESVKTFFVNSTREYLISAWDVQNNKITKFKRAYPRVKLERKESPKPTQIKRPEWKFQMDIAGLHVFKGNLWVQTSTEDNKKRVLFDVFDPDGKYIDCFFMNIRGTILATHNNHIFVRETDEEGMISIVKYRVLK
jgi:hypothetical protein